MQPQNTYGGEAVDEPKALLVSLNLRRAIPYESVDGIMHDRKKFIQARFPSVL